MDITRVYESAASRFGETGPLLVALYRGSTNLVDLDAWDAAEGRLLTTHARISTLTVITQPSSVMAVDESVRRRGVELGKKYDGKVLGSAIVVTATGLSAVMVRTFLSGFFLVSRAETPMKTFKSVAEALVWLASLPEQDVRLKTELRATDVERFFA